MKVGMVAFACYDYAVALTNALAQHCDVDFYCGEYSLRQRDPSILEALDGRVGVQRFGPFRIRDVRNLPIYSRLCREIRDRHYDVIHFQEYAPPWMTPFWRILRKVPLVMTVHDPHQHPGIPFVQSFYQDVMQNICVRRARKIIVHGRLLKEQFLERYRDKSAEDVMVLPHGDLAVARRWDHDGREECAREKKILFFGSARPNKGLQYLLQAEALLRGRLQNYRVVVAGDCGDFSRFDRHMAPGARIDVVNRFISNQELPGFFHDAAVVVLPYTSASQSGIIPLAYSFGKPVVATRVGALPDVVVDGVTGLLIEPGDPQLLADAIVTLLSNDGLREEMGGNALKYCHEHLSWDAIARKTVEVYAELSGPGV